jgi:hypothetical protein
MLILKCMVINDPILGVNEEMPFEKSQLRKLKPCLLGVKKRLFVFFV